MEVVAQTVLEFNNDKFVEIITWLDDQLGNMKDGRWMIRYHQDTPKALVIEFGSEKYKMLFDMKFSCEKIFDTADQLQAHLDERYRKMLEACNNVVGWRTGEISPISAGITVWKNRA